MQAMAAPGGVVVPGTPRRRLALLGALLLLATLGSAARPAAGARARRAPCTYTLRVKTSCASPGRTSDAVSVAFGDAYRDEVDAPRLPTANGNGALERCATDAFRVTGPCGYGVCYLYLRRAGRDGWAPEWVQVVEPGPPDAPPPTATFYFGDPLPDGVWYGHDRCPKGNAAAAEAAPRAKNVNATSAASPRG